jgi:uncharacterized protein (DUF1015 family)
MPAVYPFPAVSFKPGDASKLVAPPYDVLDAAGKQALLAKDPHNIVAIDLPHTPAKELGPPAAYESAAATYRSLLKDGTLTKQAPAMFAYRQTFTSEGGKTFQRSGMACTVETVPFGPRQGGGILPHEETFSGPKEDRFALMKATKAQLSPIFGLFADEQGLATKLLHKVMGSGKPTTTARTDDGVLHEVWTISDAATIKGYQDALAGQDVFIADGHHRYTTGLNYLKNLESQGAVHASHPARRCMMVLVGMSDPGLVIWPTHRVLGGMSGYSIDAFLKAAAGTITATSAGNDVTKLEAAMAASKGKSVLGLYDVPSGRCFTATFDQPDPLRAKFPAKPQAWRELDVALIQYIVVEQVCQPKLNGGQQIKWAFPHTIREVQAIARGAETGAGGGKAFAQLAVIVRPTPLAAVRAVSAANELMPQKSTFFYPKLATGLWVNPLE